MPKLLRLTGHLDITVKVVFELAYTVNINTFKETIDILEENQRTNGPVNAHLKPEIYTNKLV